MTIYRVRLTTFSVTVQPTNKGKHMFLKVTLTNDYELYLNLKEVCAWRPYNGKVDPADLQGCIIVDITNGSNFRLNKESSDVFIGIFESELVSNFCQLTLATRLN
jgi:hypothetical protein